MESFLGVSHDHCLEILELFCFVYFDWEGTQEHLIMKETNTNKQMDKL